MMDDFLARFDDGENNVFFKNLGNRDKNFIIKKIINKKTGKEKIYRYTEIDTLNALIIYGQTYKIVFGNQNVY